MIDGAATAERARHRLLRNADVMDRLGLGKTAFHELRNRDATFPQPVQLGVGNGAPRYYAPELDAWIVAQVAKRDAQRSVAVGKSVGKLRS